MLPRETLEDTACGSQPPWRFRGPSVACLSNPSCLPPVCLSSSCEDAHP